MRRPRICAVIVDSDVAMVRQAEEVADLLELRIDLIGDNWQELAKQLSKPWIACNRLATEGGQWDGTETKRIDELLKAVELGADIVDIELFTIDLPKAISVIKKRARCLVSFHDLTGTPPLNSLKEIAKRQLAAGADICKVVTTAQGFEDNICVLQLISEFPEAKVIAFAMGQLGLTSRILCPLVGGHLTYASIEAGKESASGQMTVRDLRKIYEMVAGC
jgi:3-dehydroquinate dehydratase type I